MSNKAPQAGIQKIPVNHLKFDPLNPRIPVEINRSDEKEVIEYLLTDANVDDLMKSLLSQGYFEGEPLLVCPSEKDDGTFVVVEGNRRLGALKLINGFPPPRKENTITTILRESPRKISEVPCIIYEKREDILGYLGYRHITGIKEWDHLAKARYLKQLYDKTVQEQKDNNLAPIDVYKILAKNIGSKYPSVENLLRGLEVLNFADDENILEKIGKKPNDIHFSLLTTALNNSNIRSYISLDSDSPINENNINSEHTQNLLSWLYGDREKNKIVRESREIQKLARVIANEDSLNFLIRNQHKSDILETSFTLAGGLLDGFEDGLRKLDNTLNSLQELLTPVSDYLNMSHIDELDIILKKARSLHASAKALVENKE